MFDRRLLLWLVASQFSVKELCFELLGRCGTGRIGQNKGLQGRGWLPDAEDEGCMSIA